MEKEKVKFKLDAVLVRFGGGYKAKMCARKRKWVSGPVRLSVQVSTSPLPTYLCNRQKNGEPPTKIVFAKTGGICYLYCT